MYAGHFAVATVLKARYPQVPATAVVGGAVAMDVLYAALLLLGVDHVTPDPLAGPYLYFKLSFIDWDHSLLMAVLLSAGWGLLWLRRGALASAVAACALASHFVLDWFVHNHDLALYPDSSIHLGLGLWGLWGAGAWLLEGAWVAACLVAYGWMLRRHPGDPRQQGQAGTSPWPAIVWVVLLFVALSPWFSPMRAVARLDMPTAQTVHALLILAGFLVPAFFLCRALATPPGPSVPA